MKTAIVIGHTGQDGTYISSLLTSKGYEVIGISSKSSSNNSKDIKHVNIEKADEVEVLIQKIKPDEIYYFAAVHQSSSDQVVDVGVLFQKSNDINVKSYTNFLEGVRKHSPSTKIFYAASSHIFGSPEPSPQNESTPMKPDCIYGITKTLGINVCSFYRENHNLFASVGIFYNHESPIRASKYVSKKIVEAAVAIKNGKQNELILGSMDSTIDWGYAPDYMKAVHSMMQLEKPDNFVISSGKLHTIRDFVDGVFGYLNLNSKSYVKVNPELITKKQKTNLFGNYSKINKATGWTPSVDFTQLIEILVDAEMKKHVSK